MIFTKEELHILSSKKKIDFIKPIEHIKENQDLPHIKLTVRDKTDKDEKNFEKLVEVVAKDERKKFGQFSKDKFDNEFIVDFRKKLGELGFQSVDVSGAFGLLMAVKEENEIDLIRKACGVTVEIFNKFVKDQLTGIIDAEKKIKHAKFGDSIEHTITDKKYLKNLNKNDFDMCYTPIVQSGGNYNLKFSAENDENNMHFGSIVCGLGTRYKSYCSNIVRTVLVSPNEEQQKIYEFLLELEEKALEKLIDGVRLCDVYNAVINMVQSRDESLLDKLTKNFGFAIGLEFREAALLITPKNKTRVRKGMVFNLAIGLSNLRNSQVSDSSSKNYAYFIGDTVLVNDSGPAEILTPSKKRIKNIAFFLKEEEDESEESEEEEIVDEAILGKGRRNAVMENKLRQEQSAEDKRKAKQKELAERLNKEALARLEQGAGPDKQEKQRKAAVSYKSLNQMPKEDEVKELKLFVDRTYETVILPIFGLPTPFHISTIKNISQSVEGDYTYLRINFFHPGSTLNSKTDPAYGTPEATFLKEITYRSTNVKEPGEISAPSSNLNTAFRMIKEVQKKYRTREAEEKEKEGIVKQDNLILSQSKGNPKLKDLYIKPNLYSKRISGMLEAHVNGFRFTSIKGDKVDILYNNIKHAFYQPCDKEMIILIHFTLKNAIMFGKKKHVDVQFYTEVGEITTDLGKHQNMHDRDDLAAEQAERELRQKLKSAFRLFCDKVEQVKPDFDFEMPIRELGFNGVPYRNTVFLQPTSSCLVHLTEWPPFVIALDEIELVHFERVNFQLKSFDMVFIFKDYNRKVTMVTAVPTTSLDSIKSWLTQSEIRYTEGPVNLNWTKIMKTISDDPKHFFEEGGWSFLDTQSDEEGAVDEEEDEEDEKYEPSGSDFEESESDESEDYTESDSDDYEDEMESGEESGKDWSELEEEAREADREREYEEKGPSKSGSKSKKRQYEDSPHKSSHKKKKHH